MNVLSVFDGMSCGKIALDRAGLNVTNYYASEIDKHAIMVSNDKYPEILRLGDITKIDGNAFNGGYLPKIDLFIGGSPCQGFSFIGTQLNFNDPRSKLFWDYVRVLKELKQHNPNIKFLLENVKMKKEYLDVISNALGVKPIMINSALLSAQNRKRYYWTNISNVKQPNDKKIMLNDVLENTQPCISFNVKTEKHLTYINNRLKKQFTAISPKKAITILTRDYSNWNGNYVKISKDDTTENITVPTSIRRLTPLECERLQTVPDNFTACVSKANRYKLLGNGWTVDIIAHILKNLQDERY